MQQLEERWRLLVETGQDAHRLRQLRGLRPAEEILLEPVAPWGQLSRLEMLLLLRPARERRLVRQRVRAREMAPRLLSQRDGRCMGPTSCWRLPEKDSRETALLRGEGPPAARPTRHRRESEMG